VRFKVDENLPREVVDILHNAGHDATSVLDQLLGGKPDSVLMQVCADELRAFITEDLDFADLRRFPPTVYCGIVVFRLHRPSLRAAMEATEMLLRQFDVEELIGKLIIVEPDRLRIRES
jgi:predicted nuclease of predicted toxin-antitoxin system